MILERVYDLAKQRLAGRNIHDVRIGLGLMAVELNNNLVGVTYVLSNEIYCQNAKLFLLQVQL